MKWLQCVAAVVWIEQEVLMTKLSSVEQRNDVARSCSTLNGVTYSHAVNPRIERL